MKYLSEEDVLKIHKRIIDKTGGSHGVRDLGGLSSALNRPRASFDNKDLYEDIFSKAAALFLSLINNHPFVDGNKRISITATSRFLYLNGYKLKASNKEVVKFCFRIVKEDSEVKRVADWLKENTEKL